MKIEIKEGTKEIESKKYIDECAVTEFFIPKSVEKIGDSAFSVYTDMMPTLKKFIVDKDNKYFDEIDNVLVSKDHRKLVAYPIGRKEKYVVPDGIETIGRHAFRMAIYLEEITLPKTVKKIEKGAFYYCKNLKRIDFGDADVSIMSNAFEKCDNISELSGTKNIEKIEKKAFIKCKNIKEMHFGGNIKGIGEEAFYGVCGTHFIFENNTPAIGDKAFVGQNIRLDIFKNMEKLLRPEIFAMNDIRKFSVLVCVLDDGKREFKIEGKLGDKTKNVLVRDCVPLIKPKLLDQIEGSVSDKDIRFCATGFFYNQNVQTYTDDDGRRGHGDFDSVLWFENDKIKYMNIRELISGYRWDSGLDNISPKEYYATEIEAKINPNGNWRGFEKSEHKYIPCVYSYAEDTFLIDFTRQKLCENEEEALDDVGSIIEHVRIWKIEVKNNNKASLITEKSSDEYKYVMEKNLELRKHYEKIKCDVDFRYLTSKENFKKSFKYSFGDFRVPDEQESLCFFWKDSHNRIFNYGNCAVYDKSQKINIGVRERSYMNIYDEGGSVIATVKFIGVPVHIEENDGMYYVLTQQKCDLPKKSKVRLYKFEFSRVYR